MLVYSWVWSIAAEIRETEPDKASSINSLSSAGIQWFWYWCIQLCLVADRDSGRGTWLTASLQQYPPFLCRNPWCCYWCIQLDLAEQIREEEPDWAPSWQYRRHRGNVLPLQKSKPWHGREHREVVNSSRISLEKSSFILFIAFVRWMCVLRYLASRWVPLWQISDSILCHTEAGCPPDKPLVSERVYFHTIELGVLYENSKLQHPRVT